MYQVRTDLALEAREKFENDNVEVKGVQVKEEHPNKNIKITKVIIETENGAKIMGKPRGTLHWKLRTWRILMKITIGKFQISLPKF